MTAKKKTKNGTSKASAQDKKVLFVEAYLSNGGNATGAALAAGYSNGGASKAGYRLSKDDQVMSMLGHRRCEIVKDMRLSTDRLCQEVARLAFSDPRGIMHSDGRMKMPHELDDDTAAAIASFEFDIDGSIKYKFWDKNSAQERAAKINGAFERDHKLQADPLRELITALNGKVLGTAKVFDDEEGD